MALGEMAGAPSEKPQQFSCPRHMNDRQSDNKHGCQGDQPMDYLPERLIFA